MGDSKFDVFENWFKWAVLFIIPYKFLANIRPPLIKEIQLGFLKARAVRHSMHLIALFWIDSRNIPPHFSNNDIAHVLNASFSLLFNRRKLEFAFVIWIKLSGKLFLELSITDKNTQNKIFTCCLDPGWLMKLRNTRGKCVIFAFM